LHMGSAEIQDLLGYREDAGLAGDDEEAVRGIATEPARPLQAVWVDGTIEAVPGQRIGNEAS
ncbi:MAG: hypothetical protein WCC99_16540, partial [Candidatus Sulfotelmatobacter sp.]